MLKKIVFIGDSITEAGRFDDPEQIGTGYVRVIHDYLRTTYPFGQMEIMNKGIGGNRITDLAARWREDVIDLQPEIVSISVGILMMYGGNLIIQTWNKFIQKNLNEFMMIY